MVFNVTPEAKIQCRTEKYLYRKGEREKMMALHDSSPNMGLIVSYRAGIVEDKDVSLYQRIRW